MVWYGVAALTEIQYSSIEYSMLQYVKNDVLYYGILYCYPMVGWVVFHGAEVGNTPWWWNYAILYFRRVWSTLVWHSIALRYSII